MAKKKNVDGYYAWVEQVVQVGKKFGCKLTFYDWPLSIWAEHIHIHVGES